MSLEGNFDPIDPNAEFFEKASNPEKEKVQESIFLSYVHERLLEDFFDSLDEIVDDDAELEEWKSALANLPQEQLHAFLAIPHEVRSRRIAVLHEQIQKGQDANGVIANAAESAYAQGYRLGYHASPYDIQPATDPKTGRTTWTIVGKENDHRNEDQSKAYYSTDLAHLYHRKNPKYLYLVRAETGENSSHSPDNDGSWGRAGKLDVVGAIEYQQAMDAVERRYAQYLQSTEPKAE